MRNYVRRACSSGPGRVHLSTVVASLAFLGCSDGGSDLGAEALVECSCRSEVVDESVCIVDGQAGCEISEATGRYIVRASRVVVSGGAADFDIGESSQITLTGGEATQLSAGDSSVIVDDGTLVDGTLGDGVELSVAGGVVGALDIRGSRASVVGGTVYEITSASAGDVFVYDGMVAAIDLQSTASVAIDGGRVATLDLRGQSSGEITGGLVNVAQATDGSRMTITGGVVEDLVVFRRGDVVITGGDVETIVVGESATVVVSGGAIGDIFTDRDRAESLRARIKLIGLEFDRPFGAVDATGSLQLTGVLADGEELDLLVVLNEGSVLELCDAASAVPDEPLDR